MLLRPRQGGGFSWWCPGCDHANGVGPGWSFNGDLLKPTFQPSIKTTWTMHGGEDSPSTDHPDSECARLGCVFHCCHLYITDGTLKYLGDCTHPLRGQTVPMVEWPYPPK